MRILKCKARTWAVRVFLCALLAAALPWPIALLLSAAFPFPEHRLEEAWSGVQVLDRAGAVLRPFIGNPDLGFDWFRTRESNFFLDVLKAIGELFA